MSDAGDVNADGHDDVVVGAPLADQAFVYSGVDRSLLHTFTGSASDRFGTSVSGAGDVNVDGFDDVIVGASRNDTNGTDSGSAYVFSGQDGSLLYTFTGNSAGDELGFSVSGAGDIDNDGHADMVVGAPYDDSTAVDAGSVYVYSGSDGAVLWSFTGSSLFHYLGQSVSDAGDANGDGYDDVVVGSVQGLARLYSGQSGTLLHAWGSPTFGDWFGVSVSGAGDVNSDGFDDIVVGAPADGLGHAYVYSGMDASLLHAFSGFFPADSLGGSVSGAGDVNGDGFDDVVVGVQQTFSAGLTGGTVRVFSGADGSALDTGFGLLEVSLGASVSGGGDTNGDGFADVIAGAPDGSAYLFESRAQSDGGRAVPYGRSCGANNRLPRMSSSGQAKIGETLTLELHGAAPNSATYIAFGIPADTTAPLDPLGVPLDALGLTGCSLHSSTFFTLPLVTDSVGRASFSVSTPNDLQQAISGTVFMHQWITLDFGVTLAPPANLPLTFSDGLMIDIGR